MVVTAFSFTASKQRIVKGWLEIMLLENNSLNS